MIHKIYLIVVLMQAAAAAMAQNEISTPAGESLKIITDTVQTTGSIRINNGILKFNNYRFLSTAGDRNIFVGNSGNMSLAGKGNSFIGASSGLAVTTGELNTFVGARAGQVNTSGTNNVFLGYESGATNLDGSFNLFVGNSSGDQNTTGSYNVFLGNETGSLNQIGSRNTYVGRGAGALLTSGELNTFIGYGSGGGEFINGSNNVFIGLLSGQNESGSNKLYIANSNTTSPLIYGDFANNTLIVNGKLGISTLNNPSSVDTTGGSANTSSYQLFVKGGVLTEQAICASNWADYVFNDQYRLKPLSEIERFIKLNGHLPGVLPTSEIKKKGVNLGNTSKFQQEKIEELILYSIAQQKHIVSQEKILEKQQRKLEDIREEIQALLSSSK